MRFHGDCRLAVNINHHSNIIGESEQEIGCFKLGSYTDGEDTAGMQSVHVASHVRFVFIFLATFQFLWALIFFPSSSKGISVFIIS